MYNNFKGIPWNPNFTALFPPTSARRPNSAAFLSRSTFLRSFQAVCGCTPHEYLRNFRIRHALELLEEGALSRTEIAHRCGFYDLAHFERAFQRYQLNQKVSVPSDLPPT